MLIGSHQRQQLEPRLQKKIQGLPDAVSKQAYEALLETSPLNNELEIAVAVDINAAGGKRYRTLPFALLYESYNEIRPECVHSALLPGRPLRPFLDIDVKTTVAPTKEELQTRADIAAFACFQKLGWSQRKCDYLVLVCRRAAGALDATKTSLHIVWIDGYHYTSPAHLRQHILVSKIKDEIEGFDPAVYKAAGSCLRAMGSVKFGEWEGQIISKEVDQVGNEREVAIPNKTFYRNLLPPIFDLLHLDSVTLEKFKLSFPAYMRADSQPYAFVFTPEQAVGIADDNPLVTAALAYVRGLNPDARLSGEPRRVGSAIHVSFADCHTCPATTHASNNRHVVINVEAEMGIFKCFGGSCVEEQVALSEDATYYRKMRETVQFLARYNLCRVDTCIYESDFGGRDQDPSIMTSRCPGFVYFRRPGTAYPWDMRYWNILRGEGESALGEMVNYLNLFLCQNDQMGIFTLRIADGTTYYQSVSFERLKRTILTSLQYDKSVQRGAGKNVVFEKKAMRFFDYWQESEQRFVSTSIHTGVYMLGCDNGKIAPLNILPPKRVSSIEAADAWNAASRPLKELLVYLWKTYLEIVVGNELPEYKENCRGWFQRWFLSMLFKLGLKTMVCVGMISKDSGTGKSWAGELICRALGPELTGRPSSFVDWLNDKFNDQNNVPFIFCDEAVHDAKSDKTGAKLKAITTSNVVQQEKKYGAKFQSSSVTNIYVTSNDTKRDGILLPGVINSGRDRRNFVEEPLSIQQANEYFVEHPFVCRHCDGPCPHSVSSREEFWTLMQQHIVGGDGPVAGPLFLPFIGMLRTLSLKVDAKNPPSLRESLPRTRMIDRHQQKISSPVIKWYDAIVARGSYFDASDHVRWRGKCILLPRELPMKDQRVSLGDHWHSYMSVESLFDIYRRDQQDAGAYVGSCESFVNELVCELEIRLKKLSCKPIALPCDRFKLETPAGFHDPPLPPVWQHLGTVENVPCLRVYKKEVVDDHLPFNRSRSASSIDIWDRDLGRTPRVEVAIPLYTEPNVSLSLSLSQPLDAEQPPRRRFISGLFAAAGLPPSPVYEPRVQEDEPEEEDSGVFEAADEEEEFSVEACAFIDAQAEEIDEDDDEQEISLARRGAPEEDGEDEEDEASVTLNSLNRGRLKRASNGEDLNHSKSKRQAEESESLSLNFSSE